MTKPSPFLSSHALSRFLHAPWPGRLLKVLGALTGLATLALVVATLLK